MLYGRQWLGDTNILLYLYTFIGKEVVLEEQVRLAATTAVDSVVAASRTLSETNGTTPTSSLGRHGCSWSSDLQGHKQPRRWLWSSSKALTVAGRVREARLVYNSRLRGDEGQGGGLGEAVRQSCRYCWGCGFRWHVASYQQMLALQGCFREDSDR